MNDFSDASARSSPRKDGNTSILIDKVFQELKIEGINTDWWDLYPTRSYT
jgi:hypothetical protein